MTEDKNLKGKYFTVNIKKLEYYLFEMTQEERDKEFDEWWEESGRAYYQELKEKDAKNNIYDTDDMELVEIEK